MYPGWTIIKCPEQAKSKKKKKTPTSVPSEYSGMLCACFHRVFLTFSEVMLLMASRPVDGSRRADKQQAVLFDAVADAES